MVSKYSLVDYEFDLVAWGEAVRDADDRLGGDLHEFVGVHRSSILRWRNGVADEGFPYPSMTNFIRVCNLIDTHPQRFFVLKED